MNLSQTLTHSRRVPLMMHRQFINSCLFCSICYFETNPSQFFKFLAIPCMIFLEDPISQFQFSIQAHFIFFEPDLPIDSLFVTEIVEIRTSDWPHGKSYLNFSFPNVWPPHPPQIQKFSAAQISLLGRPIQLSAPGFFWSFSLSLNDCTTSFWFSPKKSGNNGFSMLVCTGFPDPVTTVNRIIIYHHFREASP